MSNEPPKRSHRLLAVSLDWLILVVLVVSFGQIYGFSLPLITLLIQLFVALILLPLVYFKLLNWAVGTTVGPVIVHLLRRLYRNKIASSPAAETTEPEPPGVNFCPRCQREIDQTDHYCSECGKNLM